MHKLSFKFPKPSPETSEQPVREFFQPSEFIEPFRAVSPSEPSPSPKPIAEYIHQPSHYRHQKNQQQQQQQQQQQHKHPQQQHQPFLINEPQPKALFHHTPQHSAPAAFLLSNRGPARERQSHGQIRTLSARMPTRHAESAYDLEFVPNEHLAQSRVMQQVMAPFAPETLAKRPGQYQLRTLKGLSRGRQTPCKSRFHSFTFSKIVLCKKCTILVIVLYFSRS